MWDLLSFREGEEKYFVAERVRLAFQDLPPSEYQIQNFASTWDSMGVKGSVNFGGLFGGREIDIATLKKPGTCSATVAALTGKPELSAFDGLCKFVECVLAAELKQNKFFGS
jgi:hypothetical protein